MNLNKCILKNNKIKENKKNKKKKKVFNVCYIYDYFNFRVCYECILVYFIIELFNLNLK